jgi:hypothetical protein
VAASVQVFAVLWVVRYLDRGEDLGIGLAGAELPDSRILSTTD